MLFMPIFLSYHPTIPDEVKIYQNKEHFWKEWWMNLSKSQAHFPAFSKQKCVFRTFICIPCMCCGVILLSTQTRLPIFLLFLISTRYLHTHNNHSMDLFQTIMPKSEKGLCMKFRWISVDQQFVQYSDQPIWHQQSCNVQSLNSTLFPTLAHFGLQ